MSNYLGHRLCRKVMARRYISKNLSSDQLRLLKLLDDYALDIFSINDIREKFGNEFDNLNSIIENLVQKDVLSRIEQGKYCRHNFRDEIVISQYLVRDGIIGYWTALNKHGLTEQFSNTIFVQTTKLKRPKAVFGVNYKFIKITQRKYTGFETFGYGNHQYRMTDPEKTIVDCFDLPHYSGGYAELIRAFNQYPSDSQRLIDYTNSIQNIAVTKRLGFLAELLLPAKLQKYIKYASNKVNLKYNLFDPYGPDKGDFNSFWKLRLNISKEDIISICQNEY